MALSLILVTLLSISVSCSMEMLSPELPLGEETGTQETVTPDADKGIVQVSIPVLSSAIAAADNEEDLVVEGEEGDSISSRSFSSKAYIGATQIELTITDTESNVLANWTESSANIPMAGYELITTTSPQIPPVNGATLAVKIYNDNVSTTTPVVSGSTTFSIDGGQTASLTLIPTPVNPVALDLTSSASAAGNASSIVPMQFSFDETYGGYSMDAVGGEQWFEITLPTDVTNKALVIQGNPDNDVYGAMAVYDENGAFIDQGFNHGRSYSLYTTGREKGTACDLIIPRSQLSADGTYFLGVTLMSEDNTSALSMSINAELIDVVEESPEAIGYNPVYNSSDPHYFNTATLTDSGSISGALLDRDYIELTPSTGPSTEEITHYKAVLDFQLDALNRGFATGYALDIVQQLRDPYEAERGIAKMTLNDDTRDGSLTAIIPYYERQIYEQLYHFIRIEPYWSTTVENTYDITWSSLQEVSNVDHGVNDFNSSNSNPVQDRWDSAIAINEDTSITAQLVGRNEADVFSIDTSTLTGYQTISINFTSDTSTSPHDIRSSFWVRGQIGELVDTDDPEDGIPDDFSMKEDFEAWEIDDSGTIEYTAEFNNTSTADDTLLLTYYSDGVNAFNYDFTVSISAATPGTGVGIVVY